MADYGMRHGGAGKKYTGWLGEKKRIDNPNAVSTEISMQFSFDGKPTEIPLMVPGLDSKELYFLLSNDPTSEKFKRELPESIIKKATDHAVNRMRNGKSPFKEPEDDM